MTLVVDASVALDWCFDSERSAYGETALDHVLANGALVPFIWPAEVANGLLRGHRRGRVAAAAMMQAIAMISRLSIDVVQGDDSGGIARLVHTGSEFGLTGYDASYLLLAMDRGLSLATNDTALVTAAERAGVRIFDANAGAQAG